MEKYKVLEHTADLMIQAFGATLGELFENAAIGMCEQVVEKKVFAKVTSFDTYPINLANDIENELRDFLGWVKDLLYGYDQENMYPTKFEWDGLGEVAVYFTLLDGEKTIYSDEIKAVTFHEMQITREIFEEKWRWQTKIVFDV